MALMERMKGIQEHLIRIQEQYESIRKIKEELYVKYEKDVSDLDSKMSSTLEYLVAKKKPISNK
jgi:hypothetical protein